MSLAVCLKALPRAKYVLPGKPLWAVQANAAAGMVATLYAADATWTLDACGRLVKTADTGGQTAPVSPAAPSTALLGASGLALVATPGLQLAAVRVTTGQCLADMPCFDAATCPPRYVVSLGDSVFIVNDTWTFATCFAVDDVVAALTVPSPDKHV